MKLTRDHFQKFIRDTVFELPEAIKIHIKTSRGNNYDFDIKFIWRYGVGYPEQTKDGCTYCSVLNGNIVRFANGTEFIYQRGETNLVKLILNAAGPELKLAASDEIEFMDI